MPDNKSPPSTPDEKPSRDDSHHHHHKRHSKSRDSVSKPSKRRSSHRRASTSDKADKSPTKGYHSPSVCHSRSSPTRSPTSSSKSTPDSSKMKIQKLRLAPGVEEIRSPPFSSPTSSKHSRPSNENVAYGSTNTNPYNNGRDSDAKRNSARDSKLRMATPGVVGAPPLHGQDPFAPRFSTSTAATRPSTTPASSFASTLTGQDPASLHAHNINHDQWSAPIAAIAAPNVDEIVAARLQGREEGRSERQKENAAANRFNNNDNIVFEASPVPKDNSAKKYALAAFVIAVIVACIVVWQLLKKSDAPPQRLGPTYFNPPTEDDCLAVSKGLAVLGQEDMSMRTFAVEIEFAVTPDGMSLELLKAELEIRTQKYVLPLLIGCAAIPGPIVIENNTYVVANAHLEKSTMGTPRTGCSLLGSETTLCSLAYLEMDLFLKDAEVPSDYILELIAFVFQHKGLLALLDLLTPIQEIEEQREYEVFATSPAPSAFPSFSPSIRPVIPLPDNMPSLELCLDIANGKNHDLEGLALQEYDIYLDVILDVVD